MIKSLTFKEVRGFVVSSTQRLLRWGIVFFATGGYFGYFPIAPGTAGSLLGILIYWVADLTPQMSSVIILLLFFLGIPVSEEAEKIFGKKDAPQIVLDEIMGAFLSVSFLPREISYIVAGFFLFRFFDIVKPFPIGRLEKLRGGFGIMLDDLLAALYTNLILQLVRFIL